MFTTEYYTCVSTFNIFYLSLLPCCGKSINKLLTVSVYHTNMKQKFFTHRKNFTCLPNEYVFLARVYLFLLVHCYSKMLISCFNPAMRLIIK